VHTYANRIRTTLSASDSHASLTNTGGGYQLDVEKRSIDYFRLSNLIDAAHRSAQERNQERVRMLLEEALLLWRDPPLADVHTEWAQNWRRSVVTDEWLPANALLIDAYVDLGHTDAAFRRLNALQREHGLIPGLAHRRLTLLRKEGRHDDANSYYFFARKQLLEAGDDAAAEDLRHHHDTLARSHLDSRRTTEPIVVAHHENTATLRLLPRDIADFTGRDGLLNTLDQLAGIESGTPHPAAMALVGPAGVGKTAAAVRWAHQLSARYRIGALFLDLHGAGAAPRLEANEVVDIFLDALGYPMDYIVGPAGREAKLRALLAEHPMLIILDNAYDSAHIHPLLNALSDCVVLITSRRRLTKLSAHHDAPNITLAPLSLSSSAGLLARRIGARARKEQDAITQLARFSGGIPLALNIIAERAAGRAGTTLTTLVRQLQDPATLLHVGDDGDGTSLSSAFSLTYQDLPPAHARVFRLLGVHPGPEVSAEAVRSIAHATATETRHALDALVSAHLLHQPGDLDRYRLHDLFHQWAATLVEHDPERTPAQRRMLAYYLHSAHTADRTAFPHRHRPPTPPLEAGCLPKQFDSATEAMQWCLLERSNVGALIALAAREGFHEYAWQLPHAMIGVLKRYGFHDDAVTGMITAIASAAAAGDVHAEASSLNDLGELHLIIGNHDTADHYFQQAHELAQKHGLKVGEVTVLLNKARRHHYTGETPEAVILYRRCLALATTIGDQERQSVAAHRLADALLDLNQHHIALPHYRHALQIRQAHGDIAGQVATHTALGALLTHIGDHDGAATHCDQAAGLLDEVRGLTAPMRLHTVKAELAHARRDDGPALRYAQHAIELADRARHATGRARALATFGRILADRGNSEDAKAAWQHAAQLYRDRGRDHKADALDAAIADLDAVDPMLPHPRTGHEDTVALPAPPKPTRAPQNHPIE
jgi:tetratricopeptide (TPR) repeat protein